MQGWPHLRTLILSVCSALPITFRSLIVARVADLLAKTQVDVIAVCVPVEFHAEVALAALEAGKHVLIEKPLAADLDQADRIALRAQESGCKVLMGFNFRWHRLLRQAKELIRRGDVGQVESIRGPCLPARTISRPGWQTRRESGGGALFDQAVHVFDLSAFPARLRSGGGLRPQPFGGLGR